jgi:hypothetical protein
MSIPLTCANLRQQLDACDHLNDLAVRIHQPLETPDLVLTQALEATRVFVPAELVSIIDAILDGYAVQAAREQLQHDLYDGLPIGVLSFPDHVTKGAESV